MGRRPPRTVPPGPGPGTDMRALTDELPGPDGALPLLILDRRPGMAVRSGPDEDMTLFVSALLSKGLHLVTTTTVGEPPAPAPGWRLELSGDRAARLTAPDGSIVWSGECTQAPPWLALITRTGRCAVLIGAIGLWPGPGERPFTRIETLLAQAADAGELIAGLVEATC